MHAGSSLHVKPKLPKGLAQERSWLESYRILREQNRPFIDSLIGIICAIAGSWLNCLGAWSKDYAYHRAVNLPILITQASLPGEAWYHVGLILDWIGLVLICYGTYNIGRATYIGWRAYREKFSRDFNPDLHKGRLMRGLEAVLNEYFIPLGLTGYALGDFAIYMAWSMNYYEGVDTFFGVFTYGTFWNNFQYFIMVPSLILLASGIFYKGMNKGRSLYLRYV
jgi:hypothetical protein